MKSLFAVGIVLATVIATSAASALEAPGTLRSQRYAAYNECVHRAAQSGSANGISGAVVAVSVNYDRPLVRWAMSSLHAEPDLGCYAFLITKERAAQSALEKEHAAGSASPEH